MEVPALAGMHISRWTLIKLLFRRKRGHDLYMAGWAACDAWHQSRAQEVPRER